ncbi:MAG: hypothetical protein H8E87_06485 [FCB group bacterium]|nr:hypothetical protein [FCB group bacterium]
MKKCLIIHHSLIDIPCSIFSLLAGHTRLRRPRPARTVCLLVPTLQRGMHTIVNIEQGTRN